MNGQRYDGTFCILQIIIMLVINSETDDLLHFLGFITVYMYETFGFCGANEPLLPRNEFDRTNCIIVLVKEETTPNNNQIKYQEQGSDRECACMPGPGETLNEYSSFCQW